MKDSIKLQNALLQAHNGHLDRIDTLYIGGGTPSLWGDDGVLFIEQEIIKNLAFATKYEFTLEINPGAWKEDNLQNWIDLGLNRISVGIQTLSEKLLNNLERAHTLKESYKTLDWLANRGINFSVDLMVGIPFSDSYKVDIANDLLELFKFNPSHISLYILTPKENYKFSDNLPDENYIADQYLVASELLKAHGFFHYEVSNFAKPGMESKHNLKYWNSESVVALGPSATGFLSFSNEKIRYKWQNDLTSLPKYDVESLSENEYRLERLYLQLRTNRGIKLDDFFSKASQENLLHKKVYETWQQRGYLNGSVAQGQLILSSRGMLMLDSIMENIFHFI